jgi:hypothetical protein
MTHRHNPMFPLDDAHDRFLERVHRRYRRGMRVDGRQLIATGSTVDMRIRTGCCLQGVG